jgi:hypothetical protein
MIRVTFDHDYIDNLQDYYHRNECIREQQYLSPEKLLHLAAFCVSKAANIVDDGAESRRNGPDAEAGLDAVRQLSLLCDNADHAVGRLEPVTRVNGQTNAEREMQERHRMTAVPPTAAEKRTGYSPTLRVALSSTIRHLVGRLNICWKTPRV